MAAAADLSLATPPVAAPVARGWTGGYVGVHAGFGWNDNNATFTFFPESFGTFGFPASSPVNAKGFIGGAQIGYNYQIGRLVVGTESDISWLDNSGKFSATGISPGPAPFSYTASQKFDWFGTSRLRAGITPWERTLLYATGGVAYGSVTAATNATFNIPAGPIYLGSDSETRIGWVAGLGAEYAITNHLSAKLEYLHYDLGGATVVGYQQFGSPIQTHTHFDLAGDIVRVGLDYKIDWLLPWSGPAPALYAKAPPAVAVNDFTVATGGRFWFSTGRTQKNLFDTSGAAMVSRLTYDGLGAYSEESFARVDHWSGFFLKGYLGGGKIADGKLKDEDFPPFITPYSATSSDQKDGSLTYGAIDLGYDFLRRPSYQLGAFVGYHYYREKLNAMGCSQTAGNPGVCVPSLSDAIQVISNDGTWQSVRLGLNGEVTLIDRLTLSGDAAWLPYTTLSSRDTHWLRINDGVVGDFTGPIPEDGTGHGGYQLEAILNYLVTPNFSVGVGGRYWHMETTGNSHFEGNVIGGGGSPQPVAFKNDRYGTFVQGAFTF